MNWKRRCKMLFAALMASIVVPKATISITKKPMIPMTPLSSYFVFKNETESL
jgi:hypothetical protein